jgi:hypothetical protein
VTHDSDVTLQAVSPPGQAPAAPSQFDVCFTPMGRTFWRTDTASPLVVPLTGVITINVLRTHGGTAYGLTRPILLLPNGNARLGVAQ